MEENKENNKFDVFQEANAEFLSKLSEEDRIGLDTTEQAQYTINKNIETKAAALVDKHIDDAIAISYSTKTNAWERLKEDMENGHAERFNNILKRLPDKDFTRIYLKSLEFVKPKLIREKRKRDEEETDSTINIVIKKSNRTIDLTNIEDIDHEEI